MANSNSSRQWLGSIVMLLFVVSVIGSQSHALLLHHHHEQPECLATGSDFHLHGEEYLPTDCTLCDWLFPPYMGSPVLQVLTKPAIPSQLSANIFEGLTCKAATPCMLQRGPPYRSLI